jgi:predicted CopG family antitoxin
MNGINIMISKKTHQKLCDLGKKGETFAELIERLLEK